MFKRIRTPHGNAGAHFAKMLLYFLGAALIVLAAGLWGIRASTWAAVLGSAAVISGGGLLSGLLMTIVLRAAFRLKQTGRILQYLCFGGGISLSISVAESFLGGALVVTNQMVATVAIFVLSFGTATLAGQVPFKGRTWLPLPRTQSKKRK